MTNYVCIQDDGRTKLWHFKELYSNFDQLIVKHSCGNNMALGVGIDQVV